MKGTRIPQRLANVDYTAPRTYAITMCVDNRTPVFRDPDTARVVVRWLTRYRSEGFYYLYAFAVMPDHVHVVLRMRSRGRSLSKIIAMIRAGVRYECNRAGRDVHWQRGYHERIVRTTEDCQALVRYVLENPSRGGLVQQYEQYEFAGTIDCWR